MPQDVNLTGVYIEEIGTGVRAQVVRMRQV